MSTSKCKGLGTLFDALVPFHVLLLARVTAQIVVPPVHPDLDWLAMNRTLALEADEGRGEAVRDEGSGLLLRYGGDDEMLIIQDVGEVRDPSQERVYVLLLPDGCEGHDPRTPSCHHPANPLELRKGIRDPCRRLWSALNEEDEGGLVKPFWIDICPVCPNYAKLL